MNYFAGQNTVQLRGEPTAQAPNGCRHVFHSTCGERWLRSHGTCPICRDPVAACWVATELGSVRVPPPPDEEEEEEESDGSEEEEESDGSDLSYAPDDD